MLVSGGVTQVPSSLKYFEVPAVVLGAGTRPDLAPEPDFPNTEYVVFGGVTQVPSSLKYFEVPAVVLGAGTKPELAVEPDFPKLPIADLRVATVTISVFVEPPLLYTSFLLVES